MNSYITLPNFQGDSQKRTGKTLGQTQHSICISLDLTAIQGVSRALLSLSADEQPSN